MQRPITQVVLLGFGGPENAAEIRPFLNRVLHGRPVPTARYEEVVQHYDRIGGKSPFNALTQRQARALQTELGQRGVDYLVRVAYRHAAPFIDDVARDLEASGERSVAIVLAAQQSEASWDKYYGAIPNAVYARPFYDDPLFVAAQSERAREAFAAFSNAGYQAAALIFTAHSIPQAMADRGPYCEQLQRGAQAVVQQLGVTDWTIAFQSRSGSPAEPWLEPDVREVLAHLPERNVFRAVVLPIGFLCDHVEVLYDLDVDAKAVAASNGVQMQRAAALNDHPLFIRMLADRVLECAALPS